MTNSEANLSCKAAPLPPVLRTVFLDRDGVINRKLPEGEYVSSVERFELLAGVPEAVARLNGAGLRVIVVTNQRGVALGKYTRETVEAIHAHVAGELAASGAHADGYFYCPHDRQQCECRKPGPGMFYQAQAAFGDVTAATSVMVGDSLSDIEFGARLGMAAIFIEGDAAHRKAGAETAAAMATVTVADLAAAVAVLLG